MAARRTTCFFAAFSDELTKIAAGKKEDPSKEKRGKDRFYTKILPLIGAGVGAIPGAGYHAHEVGKSRRYWKRKAPSDLGVTPELFETMRHERTRVNVPVLARRALMGSAAGFATGALTGALVDMIRRRRKQAK